MVLCPQANLVAATAQDRDVERVDRGFEEDLRFVTSSGGRPQQSANSSTGSVSRIRRWSVQSPPRTTSVGMPGSGVMLPNEPPPPANSNEVT